MGWFSDFMGADKSPNTPSQAENRARAGNNKRAPAPSPHEQGQAAERKRINDAAIANENQKREAAKEKRRLAQIQKDKVEAKKAADKLAADQKAARKRASDRRSADAAAARKAKAKADREEAEALAKETARKSRALAAANTVTMEDAPIPDFDKMPAAQDSLKPEKNLGFGEYATIEAAPIIPFKDLANPTPSLLTPNILLPDPTTVLEDPRTRFNPPTGAKITTHISYKESHDSPFDMPQKAEKSIEDKSIGELHREFSRNDNPNANIFQKVGEFFGNLGGALSTKVEQAPVDFALDTVGGLLKFSNPFVGIALDLASEPAQRASEDRSKNGGFIGDFGQNVVENPGTVLSAVPGMEGYADLAQLGADAYLGKDISESVSKMAASVASPILSEFVPDLTTNPWINLTTKIAGTVYLTDKVADFIHDSSQGPTPTKIAGPGNTNPAIPDYIEGNGGSAPVVAPAVAPTFNYTPITSSFDLLAATPISAFSSAEQGYTEEDDTLFPNPFAIQTTRQKNEEKGETKALSRLDAFDSRFKEINALGFATGNTLLGSDDPSNQISTRRRNSGNRFEKDTVSYLARRAL